jgi:hypothetical protein
MADEIDQAQAFMELGLADAIRKASTPTFTAAGTGFCLSCDEPVASGIRWCCVECRNCWQKETGVK